MKAGPPLCRFAGLFVLALSLTDAPARADVFRPAYLEFREAAPGADTLPRYDVTWKVPMTGGLRLALRVELPAGTRSVTAPQGRVLGDAYVERWTISHPGGLAGQRVRVDGLDGAITDVIVRVERRDGSSQVARLAPHRREFVVEDATSAGQVARSYLVLGVQHILGGVDHLLFVLALLLIVRGGRRLVTTVTAFTVAHSLTLAAATLGWIRVPGPPVEAIIALSIVFVAAEAVHGLRGRAGLTARAPWIVAFSFGLLHGFGFAGALAEVGLPQRAIPVALLMFNVGVELGQLFFVAALLLAGAALARLASRLPGWTPQLLPYAIGALATFWTLERIAAFWS